MYLHSPSETPTKSQTNEEYLFEKKSVLLCIGRKQAIRTFNIKKYNSQSFFTMVASLSIRLLKDSFIKKDWILYFLLLNILVACFLPIQSNTDFFSNKYSSLVWLLVGVSLGLCRYIENKKTN